MKLNIIRQDVDFEALKIFIDLHFGCDMKYIEEKMSIFNQWSIRPIEKKFIPKVWSYRVVLNNGQYTFGTLGE